MSTITVERISYTVFPIENGRRLRTWAVIGNRRKSITATTEAKLKQKLRKISVDILNGQIDAAELDASDHRAYLAAREALKPHGIAVDLAAREYAAARDILGAVSLLDAVRFYRRHAGVEIHERNVSQVVTEFLVALSGRSEAYRRVCEQDLKHLTTAFGSRIFSELNTADLETWLASLGRAKIHLDGTKEHTPLGASRRKQVIGMLITLFRWARGRRYLMPDRSTVADAMTRERVVTDGKPVWDPKHLERALQITDQRERNWLPWLALSAFRNLRTGAILRLEWHKHFHWDDNLIELPAPRSKTRTRVVVPMTPQLKDWLAPWIGKQGHVCEARDVGDFTDRLRKRYGLPYDKNVLRRSFISYRLAATNDENLVASEANTSVKKLRSNYRQVRTLNGKLVTPALAEEWFGILRTNPANVVQLDFAIA